MHGAGAALCHAAPVLGAGQPQLLADHPQQRSVGGHVYFNSFAVYGENDHWVLLRRAESRRRWHQFLVRRISLAEKRQVRCETSTVNRGISVVRLSILHTPY